jgi:hypothetical protein
MAQTTRIKTHTLENGFLNRYLFQVSEGGVGVTRGDFMSGTGIYSYSFVGHYTLEEARKQWKQILSQGGWFHKK